MTGLSKLELYHPFPAGMQAAPPRPAIYGSKSNTEIGLGLGLGVESSFIAKILRGSHIA